MLLSIELMLEMGRRAQPDKDFWRPDTAELARWAGREAAYCLDAPEDIPTGRVLWDQIDADLGCVIIEMVPRMTPTPPA
ncbi:MAG: hypothetical protein IT509_13580 [Rhodocyclaceae bacterium]|nr:hypothetical protein [Rhodocyclaceae bacterium]